MVVAVQIRFKIFGDCFNTSQLSV